ncbi:MAG: metallophosphoesterase [Planctomycetes bacterium]|nr:metallophosphoesterase [Planctomycetota bacterium]
MTRAVSPALLLLLAACSPVRLTPAPGMILPDAPPTFVVVGDTQKTMTLEFWRPHHDAERLEVVRAIAEDRPAFVVNAGDVVCHGGSTTDWKRFCDENEALFSRGIAYFPALGNHDYYGGAERALRLRAAVFPHVGLRRWYAIRFATVLVAILDSNFDELSAREIREQEDWLSGLLRDAEADAALRHVVLVCHHPPYTNARGLSESADVQTRFVARITPKVKAFCSGHVHNYERFEKRGVQFLVTGGGGGPTREVDSEHPVHQDLYPGPRSRPFHYCRFGVDGKTLRCDVMKLQEDGSWKRVDGFECR